MMRESLVDLLDGGSGAGTASGSGTSSTRSSGHATGHTARHSSWHTTGCTAGSLIQLGDDWVAHSLDLLLLVSELVHFGSLVGIQPLDGLVTLVINGLPVIIRDLVLQLLVLQGGFHVEAIRLQAILG